MADLVVNEYALRFIGKTAISNALERGIDYRFTIKAAIPKAVIEDNENGTVDITYQAKLISCEAETKTGKIKSVSSKSWSKSKKTRWQIEAYRNEHGIELSEEDFYDKITTAILTNLEEIIHAYTN